MESLGTLQQMQARLAQLQANAQREHADIMAALPPGTCERCYGQKIIYRGVRAESCPECAPAVEAHADGVPYEFYAAAFENFSELGGNVAALKKAQTFLASDAKRDLFLSGGVGAGKTRLACSLLNEAHKRNRWCFFARVPMLLHQLQPELKESSGDLEHKLMRCDLVVLDDIGAERDQASDYTRRTLLMLYEERGDRGHRTIFTSNKTLQQLAEMQDDDRLASRIAGRADVVQLTTADQRMARRTR